MSNVIIHGNLPDPFLRRDGSRVTPEEWPEYREKLREKVIDIAYGGMPPRPDHVALEALNHQGSQFWYKVTASTGAGSVSAKLVVTVSDENGEYGLRQGKTIPKLPVLLTGDDLYENLESDTLEEAFSRGYAVAKFNRLDFANDNISRTGGVYDLFPDYTDFTTISAWAWGYMTIMDALEKIPFLDVSEVGITGNSRGGKTVLLAAICDERIKYVCPNSSGTHGCAPYRFEVTDQGPEGIRTERLDDMLNMFPLWMGQQLSEYRNNVAALPYDSNTLGTLIAPRAFMISEGMQDYWINPRGTWQSFQAVKAAYRYLGCEDMVGAWFSPREHRQKYPEFKQFLIFMDCIREGRTPDEQFRINPYPEDGKIFDWDE